jgi:carboxyl-terminal processing protease
MNQIKQKNNYFLKYFGFFIIAVTIFFGGFLFGRSANFDSSFIDEVIQRSQNKADLSIFWKVWDLIQDNYKDADKITEEDMVYGAVKGLVDSLDDPYSQFLPPSVSKRFLDNISGSFEGIGAEIGMKDDILTIIAPLQGTPAQRAGLKSGDKIMAINDTSTLDMGLDEAVTIIRGPKGSEVTLTIIREGRDKQFDISIKRGVIQIPVINWELKNENQVAYIQIYSFTKNIDDEFSRVAQEILSSSAHKIILDLRGNPGGYLSKAVNIAGWFLAEDDIVVIEDRGEDNREEYKAAGQGIFQTWPIVVLINEGSASASEILAGALRDQLNVTLIGKQSFGKGSVQEMIRLPKEASLKLTVANWITPKGISISESGLKPDISVDFTNNGSDEQLDRALEVIKNM